MMRSGSKSWISCTWRSVCPPDHRDHGAAQPLRPVMRAEPAGEQPVAVGDVDAHAGAAAGGADRARHHLRPDFEVVAACSRPRSACRWCRDDAWMRATLLARHGEHAERIVGPQIGLGGERETREVGEAAEIVGMHAGRVERARDSAGRCRRRGAASAPAARAAAPRSRRAMRSRSGRARRVAATGQAASPTSMRPRCVREWPRNSATDSPPPLVTRTS